MINKLAICNWGSMKGKTFQIMAILKNGNYSCKLIESDEEKFYEYSDRQLEIIN